MRAVAIAVIAVIAMPSRVRADNARAELVARIDDAVHAIATALDGEPDLDAALDQSRQMRELVSQLAAASRGDSRASDIVAHYRGYADAFDAAAAILRRMRLAAHSADGVLARCIKADAELSALIDKVKAHPDPDPARDLATLTASGDTYGTSWSATLAGLVAVDRAIAADLTASHLALTDSYWMSVSSHVDTASHSFATAWAERYQPVTGACEQLGLGQHHPQLAPVLDDLRKRAAATRSTTKQLIHDYNAWLRSVRALRDLAIKARDDVRGAICSATELELDGRVENVADASARELFDEATEAAAAATRLRARADDNKMKALVDGLRVTLPTVTNIERAEARGHQSSRLRGVLVVTKQRRDKALHELGCAYSNVELAAADCSAGSCRVACMKLAPRACRVVEIVPDNEHAQSDGTTSGDRDIRGLRAWYARDKSGLFARYPTLRRCENDDKSDVELTAMVTTYPACAKLAAAELGETLPEVPPDLAE